jgi:hypothetical protein
MRIRILWLIAIAVAGGCAAYAVRTLDERYGPERVRDRIDTTADATVDYGRDVAPILNRRCLVCHACYDAPCQLKMESFAGLDRGASKELVYHSSRLIEAQPTRLGIDAQTTSEWRARGFAPVLNERNQDAATNLDASVLYNMLTLKARNPLPSGKLPDGMFDLSLGRKQSCSTLEQFPDYEREHPEGGMPFAMPPIAQSEFASLTAWLSDGAKVRPVNPLATPYADAVVEWEAFFNGASLKAQLMSRYMYEHLFLADLYFDDVGTTEHFRLVRSTTPPGQAIDLITTRRPYDDPGVSRPYYRVQRNRDTLVSKTHMPYRLNAARMQRWQSLFLDADYPVTALPSYTIAQASNPFDSFRELPVTSRYQFMLDEAQYTIMGFIKGPVCRGQVAVDVIEDQFWVWFIAPEVEEKTHDAEFLASQIKDLTLPDVQGSDVVMLTRWLEYAKLEKDYLAAKAVHDRDVYPNGRALTTDLLWDGGGTNQNAALTIFRHFDNASVVKGLVGAEPKTAWVIDYPLLERIHYLLVAGYDVYGNAGHQLFSRLYMDFLRIGGEFNFLYLLPPQARDAAIAYWYRGAETKIQEFVAEYQDTFAVDTGIVYAGDDPQHELYTHLRERVASALAHEYDLSTDTVLDEALREPLVQLAATRGTAVSWLPELSLLSVETAQGTQTFTLIHNAGHTNVASLGDEAKRRVPSEDTLTVVPGFLGAYPNAFYRVTLQDLPQFVAAVSQLASESQYSAVVDRFGVRRNDPNFWAHSDVIFDQVQALNYAERGVLDYGRVENR